MISRELNPESMRWVKLNDQVINNKNSFQNYSFLLKTVSIKMVARPKLTVICLNHKKINKMETVHSCFQAASQAIELLKVTA